MEVDYIKRLYLVRHGVTAYVAARVIQGDDAPLSPEGVLETKALAARFTGIEFDVIVSSPFQRTQVTAQEIAHATGRKIVFNDDLVELRRSNSLTGKSRSDPKVVRAIRNFFKHATDENFTLKDGETAFQVVRRARRVLDFLKERPESRIAVVAHHGILTALIAAMSHDEDIEAARAFGFMYYFMLTSTTGLSIADLKTFTDNKYSTWQLIVWNDIAHLG